MNAHRTQLAAPELRFGGRRGARPRTADDATKSAVSGPHQNGSKYGQRPMLGLRRVPGAQRSKANPAPVDARLPNAVRPGPNNVRPRAPRMPLAGLLASHDARPTDAWTIRAEQRMLALRGTSSSAQSS